MVDEIVVDVATSSAGSPPTDGATHGGPPPTGSSDEIYAGILPVSDYWSMSGEYLVRRHLIPHTQLFQPDARTHP